MRTTIVHAWSGIAAKAISIALVGVSATLALAICDAGSLRDASTIGLAMFCIVFCVATLYLTLLSPIEVLGEDDYLVVRFLFHTKAIHFTAIQQTSRRLLTIPFMIESAHLILVVKTSRLAMGRFMIQQEGCIVDPDHRREIAAANYRTPFDDFLDHARSLPDDTIGAGPYRTHIGSLEHR